MFFLGVRGFLFGNFRLGNLEFPKIRHFERSEAISRNSKFILGILDFYPRNSRILYYVILGLDPRISIRNFRIFCDEIPQSSWGMTKKVKSGDDTRLREF